MSRKTESTLTTMEEIPMIKKATSEFSMVLVRAEEIQSVLGIKVITWRRQNKLGKTPAPLIIGKGQFWRSQELLDWVEAGAPNRKTWEAIRKAKT